MAVATITIAVSSTYGGSTQNTDYIGTTAPAVPYHGMRWWNPEYGRMFMYYDEVKAGVPGGDSAQWIMVGI